jgi:hypothetical protein
MKMNRIVSIKILKSSITIIIRIIKDSTKTVVKHNRISYNITTMLIIWDTMDNLCINKCHHQFHRLI